jgi:hypothetical protein
LTASRREHHEADERAGKREQATDLERAVEPLRER